MASFESRLDAARAAYERNDPHGALRALDAARRAALKARDEERLERVLAFAEGVIARDERTEVDRDHVLYATRQNLRQLSRARSLRAADVWVDPFPDLEAPRPHTRTFISRGLKFWIAVGVGVGLLAVAGAIAITIQGTFEDAPQLALRIRNDTAQRVTVKWCENVSCDGTYDPQSVTHLDPREYARRDLPADDIVDLFVVEDGQGNRIGCLPVRVDESYDSLLDKRQVTVVRASAMTPCPGEIVRPEPGR